MQVGGRPARLVTYPADVLEARQLDGLVVAERIALLGGGVNTRLGNAVSLTPPGPPSSLNMVAIPAATSPMGSVVVGGGAAPVHPVTINRPFWVGNYEVTQGQYQSLMGSNPSRWQALPRPVEQVTWHDAMAYCAALTTSEAAAGRVPFGYQYRLPTEGEWDNCCRAGATTEWNTASPLYVTDANCVSFFGQAVNVGGYAANPWELFDTHGHVWEWCLDWWNGSANYPTSAVTDPYVATGSDRVVRGGAWNYPADSCRSANRNISYPGPNIDVGFRVVLAPMLVP